MPDNTQKHGLSDTRNKPPLCDAAQLQRLRYVGGLQNANLRNLVLNKGMQLQDAQYRESVERLISEWDDLMVQAFRDADAPHNTRISRATQERRLDDVVGPDGD